MAEILIPIGHDVGPFYERPGASGPATYDLRFADGAFQLSRDEYVVWRLASGDPDQVVTDGPPSRATLDVQAKADGVANPRKVLEELATAGAIAALETDSDLAVQTFAHNHRVFPTQRGLGNTAIDPSLFAIYAEGLQPVAVSAATYYLWMYGHLQPSLWGACQVLFAERTPANLQGANEPLDLLRDFFLFLPQLLAGDCVYVDRSI